MPETRHPCPCCGYRTYAEAAGGTMQLCPVCFWEDAPGEHPYNNSNRVTLVEAQANFEAKGACEGQYIDAVRAPLEEEARSADWLSVAGFRAKVLDLIEEAFADVALDDGVTLHQMDVIDDYGGEKEQLEARRKDPEKRWQDLSKAKLSRFSGSMTFLDGKGFRFYLPAFMKHALLTSIPDVESAELDGVMWALDGGPADEYYGSSVSLLSPLQLVATAAFLHFFARYRESYTQRDALKGLKRGWDAFTPDFVKLATL